MGDGLGAWDILDIFRLVRWGFGKAVQYSIRGDRVNCYSVVPVQRG
jgi:hypothetical protein